MIVKPDDTPEEHTTLKKLSSRKWYEEKNSICSKLRDHRVHQVTKQIFKEGLYIFSGTEFGRNGLNLSFVFGTVFGRN